LKQIDRSIFRFLRKVHILILTLIEVDKYTSFKNLRQKKQPINFVQLFLLFPYNYSGVTLEHQIKNRKEYFKQFIDVFQKTNILRYPFFDKLTDRKKEYYKRNPLPNNEFALCLYLYYQGLTTKLYEEQRHNILSYFTSQDLEGVSFNSSSMWTTQMRPESECSIYNKVIKQGRKRKKQVEEEEIGVKEPKRKTFKRHF